MARTALSAAELRAHAESRATEAQKATMAKMLGMGCWELHSVDGYRDKDAVLVFRAKREGRMGALMPDGTLDCSTTRTIRYRLPK